MAQFTSSSPGDPYARPNDLANLGQALGTAQTIQGNAQSLALNQQKVLDQQQEVALRPQIAAGSPGALNSLAALDPAAATAQLQYKSATASIPLARAAAIQGFQAQGARAVSLSSNPKNAYEGPGGYVEHMASQGIQVPPTYDPAYVSSLAYSGMDADSFSKLMTSRPYTPGLTDGGQGGGTPSAAPPAGTPAVTNGAVGLTGPQGPNSPRGLGDGTPPDAAQLALFNQPLTPADGVGAPQATPADLASMGGVPAPAPAAAPNSLTTLNPANAGASATPMGGYTPGDPSDVSAQQPDRGVIAVTASGANPTPTPAAVSAPVPHFPAESAVAAPAVSTATVPGGDDLHETVPASITLPGGQTVAPVVADRNFLPTYVNGKVLMSPDAKYVIGYNTPAGGGAPVPAVHFAPGGDADPVKLIASAAIKNWTDQGYIVQPDAQGLPQIVGALPGTAAALGGQVGLEKAKSAIDVQAKGIEAQQSAAAEGPGALLQPTPGGQAPEPPVSPFANIPNNAAGTDRYKQLTADATTQMSKDGDTQEGLQEDAENAQHFIDLSKSTPTGMIPGSDFVQGLRAAGLTAKGPEAYQMLKKYSAQMQTSGLPKGFSRLDIPIVRAVTAAQPNVLNANVVNESIASMKVARDNREMQYLSARQDYAAHHNGVIAGFDQMWSDYNSNVPTTAYVDPRAGQPGGSQYAIAGLKVNDAAPTFSQWTMLRANPQTGRYMPSLAGLSDTQVQQLKNPPAQTPVGQQPSVQPAADFTARYNATHPDQQSGLAQGGGQPAQAAPIGVGTIAVGPGGAKLQWNGSQWEGVH